MTKLTVDGNTVYSAVVRAVVSAFPDIPVYKEMINEGCTYPYFMIYCEDFGEKKLMRENYLQTFIISVLYQYKKLPETSYNNFNDICYKLSEALQLITLDNGDKLRGYNKHYYPELQKFEYYINYDIKVAKEPKNKVKMMTRQVNITTKQRRN
jgi:hypothetical protein